MMRLTLVRSTSEETTIQVEGWLTREHVGSLAQEVGRCASRTRHLVLTLDGVRYVDQTAVDLLLRWAAAGVELRGGSSFVRFVLQQGLPR